MRTIVILGVSFALLAFSPFARAQRSGLEIAPFDSRSRLEDVSSLPNPARVADDRKQAAVDTHPFDPHDLTGVWATLVFHRISRHVRHSPRRDKNYLQP